MSLLLDRATRAFIEDEWLGVNDRFVLVDTTDHLNNKQYTGNMYDKQTGYIYDFARTNELFPKFVAALCALPVYAITKSTYHATVATYVVLETLIVALETFVGYAELDFPKQACGFGHHSIEVVRSGYYFAGISLVLIRGIVLSNFSNPLHAFETRVMVAHLEKEWSHDVLRNRDFRYYKEHHKMDKVSYFFLAFCFQPYGNIEDTYPESKSLRYTIRELGVL